MKQSLFLLLLTITVGTVSAKADNITFADANVKALCVANWDTDNDGELSTEEAAAVTSFGTVFKGKKNITTFDEMRYFTGVTEIGENSFSGSSIGPTLNIPGTVKKIGECAFKSCKSLKRIRIEEGIEVISLDAFSGPLEYISFPSTITMINSMAVNPYVTGETSSGITVPEGDLWVYSYACSPADIDRFAFYYVFDESHIIVPPGRIDNYKAVRGWSHFHEYYELGDVNRNGTLDDADLEDIISYLDGTEPEGFYADMADINGDGDVDEKDIQLLRDYLYPIQLGDVNGDGAVNVLDVTTLVSYVLNEPTSPFVEAAADVNGDGNINSLDITAIVSLILNQE